MISEQFLWAYLHRFLFSRPYASVYKVYKPKFPRMSAMEITEGMVEDQKTTTSETATMEVEHKLEEESKICYFIIFIFSSLI